MMRPESKTKTLTFSKMKSDVRDRFSYILVFCPNFPAGTRSTTKTEFEKMISFIDALLEQSKNDEAKQWLRICLQEVRQSWNHYEEGKISEGRKMIQRAEEHFKNSFSKKEIKARFIAGETGTAQDAESGFPS